MLAEVFGKVQVDLDHPGGPERMRPVLAYVRRLTVDPAAVGIANAQAVYDVRFFEEGLFDIISMTSLCYFMNRILEGAGIKKQMRVMEMTHEMRRNYRYTHLWRTISKGQTPLG